MNDLISRQAAIEAIEEMQIPIMRSTFPEEQFVFTGMSEALSAIKDLPSAQPERWIPCSERLPELDESVLATTAWNDITIAWRIGICEWFIHEGNTNAETADVIAWMPLPEPYKGEQE